MKCRDCRFFSSETRNECRKNPPTVMTLSVTPTYGGAYGTTVVNKYVNDTVFPTVDADNWCGEYEAKK